MRICIDSCVFIRGLKEPPSDAGQVLELFSPTLKVFIPRLIAIEVTRNLHFRSDVARFYQLFHKRRYASIVEEPIPEDLFRRYVQLGLSVKGDAYIGAFAEWMRVNYLIYDNRYFLRDLRTDAYQLLSPGDCLEVLRRL
jgi:hypothetical protein